MPCLVVLTCIQPLFVASNRNVASVSASLAFSHRVLHHIIANHVVKEAHERRLPLADSVHPYASRGKNSRPRWDSNPQSPDPKSGALSITLRGHITLDAVFNSPEFWSPNTADCTYSQYATHTRRRRALHHGCAPKVRHCVRLSNTLKPLSTFSIVAIVFRKSALLPPKATRGLHSSPLPKMGHNSCCHAQLFPIHREIARLEEDGSTRATAPDILHDASVISNRACVSSTTRSTPSSACLF